MVISNLHNSQGNIKQTLFIILPKSHLKDSSLKLITTLPLQIIYHTSKEEVGIKINNHYKTPIQLCAEDCEKGLEMLKKSKP